MRCCCDCQIQLKDLASLDKNQIVPGAHTGEKVVCKCPVEQNNVSCPHRKVVAQSQVLAVLHDRIGRFVLHLLPGVHSPTLRCVGYHYSSYPVVFLLELDLNE